MPQPHRETRCCPARRGRGGKTLFVAGLAAIAVVVATATQPRYPDLAAPFSKRQPIMVAASDDSFPYAYSDDNGRWVGFSADLFDAVAREMNLRFERVAGPGREMQERFRLGEFDCLQALTQTADRETYADFSVPYLTLQGSIFVQKRGSPIRRLEDFNGRRFAIIGAGSIGQKFIHDQKLAVVPVYVSSSEQGLRLVDRGECAGVFVSALTAYAVAERFGIRNVEMFGAPVDDYDIRHSFAVHKGDAVLLARLNEGLARLRQSGEYQTIHRRWFGGLGGPLVTREQMLTYVAYALALGFVIAVYGFVRQRLLRRRIARQTEELAAQRAVLQAIYDNVPLGLVVFDVAPDGWRLLTHNREAAPWLGVAPREAAGQRWPDLPVAPEWRAALDELFARFAPAAGQVREERTLAGARQRLVFSLVPLAAGPEGWPRCCLLVEDVSELRHLDEEVAQSRKLRAVGELVGGIAHEFNNLLTPIMLKVGEIRFDWPEDPRLHAELEPINAAVQRAAELTRRLLTFGRKSDLRVEAVTLTGAVDSCFALLRLTVDRRIQWQNAVPGGLSPLFFNATDLNQIILNLILNARDTLMEKLVRRPDGWTPAIRIEAEELPADSFRPSAQSPSSRQVVGWQRLTVRDNGMGMAPEVRERIFEPFYTTKDVGKGTGLGLATVWHLVTEVSGRIEVESTPDEGTAFHVYLPVLPVPADRRAATAVAATTPMGHARLFLAEDDALVAATVLTAVRRAGHEATHFANGAEAWTHLQANFGNYDLIVLDVNMPGLDGIELARRVRQSGRYAGRIMVVSGRLSSADLRHLSETRVDRVLTKPFELEEFFGAVRDCLSRNPAPPAAQPATTAAAAGSGTVASRPTSAVPATRDGNGEPAQARPGESAAPRTDSVEPPGLVTPREGGSGAVASAPNAPVPPNSAA